MSALLRAIGLLVLAAVAYGAGRANTAEAAPCRGGLL